MMYTKPSGKSFGRSGIQSASMRMTNAVTSMTTMCQ